MKKLEEIKFFDGRDMIEEPLPETNWAVGRMFAEGDLVLFYGKSGSMKSFLLLDMAIHLAGGKPWLYQHIDKPSYVLFIDEKMGETRTQRRIHRIVNALDFRPEGNRLSVAFCNGMILQGNDFKNMLTGYQNAVKRQPDVVIIDTLCSTIIDGQNNSADVNHMWDEVYSVKAMGMTVIFSHQTYEDGDDIESVSEYLAQGVDSAFSVQKKPGEILIAVEHKRFRVKQGEKALRIKAVDHGPHENGPISFELAEPEKRKKAARQKS